MSSAPVLNGGVVVFFSRTGFPGYSGEYQLSAVSSRDNVVKKQEIW